MQGRMVTTTSAVAESVGALLRQAREEAGLSRQAVSTRTRIPERYVTLFEDGDKAIPEDVYTTIYLKAYAKFLGFDTASIVSLYKKERGRPAAPAPVPERVAKRQHPASSLPKTAFVSAPKIIQAVLICLLIAGLAAYFGLEVKKIFAPPAISLLTPPDGLVTSERSIVIEGRTDREVSLRVNGKRISPDDNGNFRDMLELQEGLNLITIAGVKKHSREMTVTRRIIVTPKDRATATLPEFGPPAPGL